jgi:hypothetical protein
MDYFEGVRQQLDNGTPPDDISPFARDKVFICGEDFPAEQYPSQEIIDHFTPKPAKTRGCNPYRLEEIAQYFRNVKEAIENGTEICEVPLDWPTMLKGHDWPPS